MGMHLQLVPRLEMRQEMRLELGIGLFDEEEWLTGAPKDLEKLLEEQPQVDEEGGINYLLSGGWAIEMLTEVPREHHDLDIIRLSRVPLSFKVDEQRPKNYFQTISTTAQEMLDNYTQVVNWNMELMYPDISDKEFEVYVPSNEYLFLSKLVGFLREPREKDYDDLESLTCIMKPDRQTSKKFKQLLKHIPGVQNKIVKNEKLLSRLCPGSLAYGEFGVAADYIIEIIRNFKKGDSAFARKQAARVHDVLRRVYNHGLEGAIEISQSGIARKILENAWNNHELTGFWINGDNGPELHIPKTTGNTNHIRYLKAWRNGEQRSGVKFEEFEILNPNIYLGKTKESKYSIVAHRRKSATPAKYSQVDLLEKRVIVAQKEVNGRQQFDVMDHKGGILFATDAYLRNRSGCSVGVCFTKLLESGELENAKDIMDKFSDKYSFSQSIGQQYADAIKDSVEDNFALAKKYEKLFKISVKSKREWHRIAFLRAISYLDIPFSMEYLDNLSAIFGRYMIKVDDVVRERMVETYKNALESGEDEFATKFAKRFFPDTKEIIDDKLAKEKAEADEYRKKYMSSETKLVKQVPAESRRDSFTTKDVELSKNIGGINLGLGEIINSYLKGSKSGKDYGISIGSIREVVQIGNSNILNFLKQRASSSQVNNSYGGIREIFSVGSHQDLYLGFSEDQRIYVAGEARVEQKGSRLIVDKLEGKLLLPKSLSEIKFNIVRDSGDIDGEIVHPGHIVASSGDVSLELYAPLIVRACISSGDMKVKRMKFDKHGVYIPENKEPIGTLFVITSSGDIKIDYKLGKKHFFFF